MFKNQSDAKTGIPKNSRNSTEIGSERETPRINVNLSPVVKRNDMKAEVFSDVSEAKSKFIKINPFYPEQYEGENL